MIFYQLCKILTFGICLISTVTCDADDEDCVCVLGYRCNDDPISNPWTERSQLSNCPNDREICCKKNQIDESSEMLEKQCGESEQILTLKVDLSSDKISDSTRYPWTLVLFDGNLKFLCGASLLGPRVAVTVAHNIPKNFKKSSLIIRAGEFNIKDDDENLPHQDRVVSRVIKHPKYDSNRHTYNIALLFWDKPLDMDSGNINTICLPTNNEIFDYENQNCIVTGWGTSDSSDLTKYSDEIRSINLNMVDKTNCERRINEELEGASDFRLHETQICVGGETGKDTCKGDGGSPFVCLKPGEERYKLVGLVAMGLGCGKPVPAIYTNVPNLVNWINKEISNELP